MVLSSTTGNGFEYGKDFLMPKEEHSAKEFLLLPLFPWLPFLWREAWELKGTVFFVPLHPLQQKAVFLLLSSLLL